jgi:hypothetical protein
MIDLLLREKRQKNGRITIGKFKVGNKFGKGRGLGTKNKTTLIVEKIGIESVEEVYRHWIALALGKTKEGDGVACKGILDRVCPARKGRNIALEFERYPISNIQDVNELSEHITTMVITGEMSAEEAEDYGKVLERRTKDIINSDAAGKLETMYQQIGEMKNK